MDTRVFVHALAERAGIGPVLGRGLEIRSMVFGVAVVLGLLASVDGATLKFSHPYHEIVDSRPIWVYVDSGSNDGKYRCLDQITMARAGTRFTVHAHNAMNNALPYKCPHSLATKAGIEIGPLAAESYEVTMHIWSNDGTTMESFARPLEVLPLYGRCNRDPLLAPSIVGYQTQDGITPEEFVSKVSNNASFAASIGNPAVTLTRESDVFFGDYSLVGLTYPPLQGIPPALERLRQRSRIAAYPRSREQCAAAPAPDVAAAVVEYFHAGRDRYFYTGDAGEIAAIDAGKVGPGWVRTGKSFNAVTAPGCPFAHGQSVVYRFNGIPGKGPDSHFFTRDRAECYVVDKSAKWSFEGLPFWASAPNADGTCDPLPGVGPRVPLHRAWRPIGDSNHRFSTDRAVIDEMVARGWIDEGPAMCVLGSI